MPEPTGQEWNWDYWEIHGTSALRAASFALVPSHLSGRFFLLLCFLCQQRLSLGPLVSDQSHPCPTNFLDPAHHATHGPCERTIAPSTYNKKRRSLSRRLLHTENNDLIFGLGAQMHFTMHCTLPFMWRTQRTISKWWSSVPGPRSSTKEIMIKWLTIPDLTTPSSSSALLPTQLTSGKCIIFVHLMQKCSFYFAYRKLTRAKIRLKIEIIPQIGLDIHLTDKLLNAPFYIFKKFSRDNIQSYSGCNKWWEKPDQMLLVHQSPWNMSRLYHYREHSGEIKNLAWMPFIHVHGASTRPMHGMNAT